jgi:hypothetical protein
MEKKSASIKLSDRIESKKLFKSYQSLLSDSLFWAMPKTINFYSLKNCEPSTIKSSELSNLYLSPSHVLSYFSNYLSFAKLKNLYKKSRTLFPLLSKPKNT